MVDLLLITDLPRVIRIFSQLEEEAGINLRIATSLDSVAREIEQDKPAIIFLQSHLSGFSADILLMHLKKLLGRKRCRFVLLTSADQAADEIIQQFNACIDTALDDLELSAAAIQTISLQIHKSKAYPDHADLGAELLDTPPEETVQPKQYTSQFSPTDNAVLPAAAKPSDAETTPPPPAVAKGEPSLEEQGVVYTPKRKLSVYSEFTSSFDTAVEKINPASQETDHDNWEELAELSEEKQRFNIPKAVKWALPLLAIVTLATYFQHSCSGNKNDEIVEPAVKPENVAATALQQAQQKAATKEAAVPTPVPPPAAPKLAKELDDIPEFITSGTQLDKSYAKAHPGWQRHRSEKREYKLYREGKKVRAIQIIDRSGKGLSEVFLNGILGKWLSAPAFVMESSEKKDGYEIQRGSFATNLKAVYYRDNAGGGKLNAIVFTWQ